MVDGGDDNDDTSLVVMVVIVGSGVCFRNVISGEYFLAWVHCGRVQNVFGGFARAATGGFAMTPFAASTLTESS